MYTSNKMRVGRKRKEGKVKKSKVKKSKEKDGSLSRISLFVHMNLEKRLKHQMKDGVDGKTIFYYGRMLNNLEQTKLVTSTALRRS